MKTSRLLCALCAILFTIPAALAKKQPADFSPFAGNYNGSILLSLGSVSYPGNATINIRGPRSGKSAIATINGSISGGGSTAPFSGTFTFNAKTFVTSDLLLNLGGSATTADTVPSKLKKTKISASGPFTYTNVTGTIQCLTNVRPQGKKKKLLTMTYTLVAPGIVYTYQFRVTAKVRK